VWLVAPLVFARQQPPSGQATSSGIVQPRVWDGTAAISGTVTDAATHAPIPGVMVYLGFQGRGAVGRLSRQISDDRGRFVFTDLPAGNNFFVNASKPGYVDGHYGTGAGGLVGGLMTLADGQWFSDAAIVMSRLASIGGTVLDEHGDPVVGAYVRALTQILVAGRPHVAAGPVTRTDDRGMYRIGELLPGTYFVQVPMVQQSFPAGMTAAEMAGVANPADSRGAIPDPPPAVDVGGAVRLVAGAFPMPRADVRGRTYAPVFFPGAPNLASATAIDLRSGDARGGLDLVLRPVPAVTIAGTIEGPAESLSGGIVRLLPEGEEELGLGSEVATATLGTDGRFTLVNVPPGSYTLIASRVISELTFRAPLSSAGVPLPNPPGLSNRGASAGSIISGPPGTTLQARTVPGSSEYFAQATVTVGDRPLADLRVPMKRASSIRGTLVNESGEPLVMGRPPALLRVEPADGNLALGIRAVPLNQNTFSVDGLLPGRYVLRVAAGMAVKSMTTGGEGPLVTPLDTTDGRDYDIVMTMTDKVSALSGFASDARGQQVKNAIVMAFPVERDEWTAYGLTPARL
jgi:hypothetical protein